MTQVKRDGSYIVFCLPHSTEVFRLTVEEALHLGEALLSHYFTSPYPESAT